MLGKCPSSLVLLFCPLISLSSVSLLSLYPSLVTKGRLQTRGSLFFFFPLKERASVVFMTHLRPQLLLSSLGFNWLRLSRALSSHSSVGGGGLLGFQAKNPPGHSSTSHNAPLQSFIHWCYYHSSFYNPWIFTHENKGLFFTFSTSLTQ